MAENIRMRASVGDENCKTSGISTNKVSQRHQNFREGETDPDLRIQASSRSLTKAKINEQVRGHKFRKDLLNFQVGVLWGKRAG